MNEIKSNDDKCHLFVTDQASVSVTLRNENNCSKRIMLIC